jgi:hypothetical protein
MEGAIEHALAEMGDLLCRCGVSGVCQIDENTFILRLFGKGCFGDLLIGVGKGAGRFHLLCEEVHRDYCITSQGSALLGKYLSRTRIGALRLTGPCLRVDFTRGETRTLHADFEAAALSLADCKGDSLFELRGRRPQPQFRGLAPHEVGLAPHYRGRKSPVMGLPSSTLGRGSPGLCFERKTEHIPPAQPKTTPSFPVNRTLSEEYLLQQNESLARRVLVLFRGERKKVRRLMEKLEKERQEAGQRESYRKRGELLKYNMHRLQRGASSVRLTDFDGSVVDIALDPLLSPQENMARYFSLYKKLKRRDAVIGDKMTFERKRLVLLDDLIDRIGKGGLLSITLSPAKFVDSLDRDSLTPAFHERIRRLFYPRDRREQGSVKAGPFLRFISRTGREILVGRNGRENDELTLRRARGNDLWFHVETGPGSHVVLRREGMKEFQDSDIIDAATLALYFSPLRKMRGGNVVYTFRKFVRKPKGSAPGHVVFYNNKTKHVRFDDAVLNHLLDDRPRGLIFER